MKKAEEKQDADMLDEYDFTSGVRGKYAARYAAGVTVTVKPTPVVRADSSSPPHPALSSHQASARFKRACSAPLPAHASGEGSGALGPAA